MVRKMCIPETVIRNDQRIRHLNQQIILVAPEGKVEEAVMRLARVGYDNVLGYLNGGLDAWTAAGKEAVSVKSLSPEEFAENGVGSAKVLDVRKPSEWDEGHLQNAQNLPLDFFSELIESVDFGHGR